MQFSVVHICFFYSEVATLNSFVKCYPLLHDYKKGISEAAGQVAIAKCPKSTIYNIFPHERAN